MAYETIFMEKADLAKYLLYQALMAHTDRELTISDIASAMAENYQTVYAVFQEVVADVAALTDKTQNQVRNALLAKGPLVLGVDLYRAYLVKQSQMFKLLDYTVQASGASFEAFVADNFTSRSTVQRKLKPVNTVLKRFGIKLRMTQLKFIGSELSIRYFLFTMYWWAFRGTEWPFRTVRQSDMAQERQALSIREPEPLLSVQDEYFLALNHLRLGKGHKIEPDHMLSELDAQIVAQGRRPAVAQNKLAKNTVTFYNFFQISMPRFDTAFQAPGTMQRNQALIDNAATNKIVDRLSLAVDTLVPPRPEPELRMNLLRLTFGYLLFKAPFPQTQEYLLDGEPAPGDVGLRQLLYNHVAPLIEDSPYADHIAMLDGYVRQAAALIEPYVQSVLHTGMVRVQVALPPTEVGNRRLHEYINAVPWISHTANAGADLVVTNDAVHTKSDCVARQVEWMENAMQLGAFRHGLADTIMQVHAEKQY